MSPRKPNDYRNELRPIWCAGCGDYAVHAALMRALAAQDLPPENVVIASGIGCSSRLPDHVNAYGFHGVHGRALPLATGIKLANPALTVLAVGGDGDGFSIGAGHLPHAARRNIDLTYIVMDNNIYGLTKGQPSPTSPEGLKKKAAPYGTREEPLNPLLMMLAYGTTFVARAFSGQINQMVEIFQAALQHPGFAFVQVLSPCVTYNNTYDHYKQITAPLPTDHDPSDYAAALRLAQITETQYLGLFYQDRTRPGYSAQLHELQALTSPLTADQVIDKYRV